MFDWINIIDNLDMSNNDKECLKRIRVFRASSELVELSVKLSVIDKLHSNRFDNPIALYKKYGVSIKEIVAQMHPGIKALTLQPLNSLYNYDISVNGRNPDEYKYSPGSRGRNPTHRVC